MVRAGRAAQRLQEETGAEAMTIHRLLGSRGDLEEEVFRHGPGNPLEVDVLLIDEASMLDLPIATALFEALPSSKVHVVLIGESNFPVHGSTAGQCYFCIAIIL